MDTLKICGGCGVKLTPASTEGFCPTCLARRRPDAAFAEGLSPVSSHRFTAPHPIGLVPWFPQLEILCLLGRGGMGAVYKARQRGLDRLVALKILPPQISGDPAFAERFAREARALARLSHPNIVTVFDVGEDQGHPYIALELVEGGTLGDEIKSHKSLTTRDIVGPDMAAVRALDSDACIPKRSLERHDIAGFESRRIGVRDIVGERGRARFQPLRS